ncbi:Kinesin-like protein KIF25 [Holothuria leucospilota]|uniref:Kinesin-like protein KIF25 n=1 Tax=Holothuria leucospilota TaxID=206669 RepID=A0A9Q1GXH2_HOLLE|nr:Kinesin-like protein KIF25 [Holothuria leucospilota]
MMPLSLDFSDFLGSKVKECDLLLMKKDEKITALETENALLHLKLSKLKGQLQEERKQKDLKGDQLLTAANIHHSWRMKGKALSEEIKMLKECLTDLREQVEDIPFRMEETMKPAVDVAQIIEERLSIRDATLRDLEENLQRYKEELIETQERYLKEKQRRKALHNTLVELRGNIRVYCRTRPILSFDGGSDHGELIHRPSCSREEVISVIDDETLSIKCDRPGAPTSTKSFEFERVFGPNDSQSDVFSDIKPLLTSLLDGYNVCMMAYGQTGSGKTYTMLGQDYTPTGMSPEAKGNTDKTHDGIIPRAGRELFRLMREKSTATYTVEVSVVEVYNNEIRDLLTADPGGMRHDVFTAEDGAMEITALSTRLIHSVDDLIHFVHHGMTHRHEDATLIHAHSSRSHLVVTLTVTGVPTPTRTGINTGDEIVKTKLQLVDLAGSECVGVSGVKGTALREASFINRSLSALADVLGALAENRTHVPYRNSRLTHLLQDSIGGDAKLLVICCVSPTRRFLSETLQCLGFGSRARQIQRGPVKRRPVIGGHSDATGGEPLSPVVRTKRSHSLSSLQSKLGCLSRDNSNHLTLLSQKQVWFQATSYLKNPIVMLGWQDQHQTWLKDTLSDVVYYCSTE